MSRPEGASRVTLDGVSQLTDTREFYGAVAACGGDYWLTYSAAKNALIDWLSRGQRMEIRRHAEQAAKLRDALDVMNEYRAVIEHNLSGCVIHDPKTGKNLTLAPWCVPDSPVNAGPVLNAVASVILQLADDLETRNPVGMRDRKDRSFYYCVGRCFSAAGLAKPSAAALRGIGEAVGLTHDKAKNVEDADIHHSYDDGARCMSVEK